MDSRVRIAFDVMGFEGDTRQAIDAAIEFSRLNTNVELHLVGEKTKINIYLDNTEKSKTSRIFVVHAPDVILPQDGIMSARNKKNSSLVVAIELVKDKKCDAIVSAASTMAFVGLTYLRFGLLDGLKKPAFMPWVPTIDGKGFFMLDVGANLENTGEELYKFAQMANAYCQHVNKIEKPRINVLNIGTESSKGFEYHHKAAELISSSKNLNYLGYKEPKELLDGGHDIIICDGYSGNLTLKTLEGSFRTFTRLVRKSFKGKIKRLFHFRLMLSVKKDMMVLDYRHNAGAIVIGLKEIAIKTHGSAEYFQFLSSLRMAVNAVNNNLIEVVSKSIK
jgi:glycerol-3-phosphate acyltransferase PlsX